MTIFSFFYEPVSRDATEPVLGSFELACFAGSEPMNVLRASRAALARKLPVQTHRVAGVTFEGRQSTLTLLSELLPDERSVSLMFEKEPENPFDADAVAVKLVDNTKLGYVPRAETGSFRYSLCFGRLRSLGQAKDTSNFGCIVEVQPQLPPAMNLAVPADLVPLCSRLVSDLSSSGDEAWDTYRTELCRRMGNRCSISNAETDNVEARWSICGADRTVRLAGFALQHPLLARMQYIDPDDFVDFEEICSVISAMNPGMREDEASMVFSRQLDLAESRASEGWTLDLSNVDDLLGAA